MLNGFTGGVMFLLAFIEPPQVDVIETIMRHRGLWQASGPKAHWVFAGWERLTAHKISKHRFESAVAPRRITFIGGNQISYA